MSLRRRFQNWKERDQIIRDMQQGKYDHKQTMWRLEQHAKPGGSERDHVWSCKQGFVPCSCPFLFDQQDLVTLGPGESYIGGWHDVGEI